MDLNKKHFSKTTFLCKIYRKYRKFYILNIPRRLVMKILSNEQLVAAYRDAEKQGNDQDWIQLLRKEIRNRGLKPFRKS
jgi:hypothetical protein